MNASYIKPHRWEVLVCLLALAVAIFTIWTIEARRPTTSDQTYSRARSDLRVLLGALNGHHAEKRVFPTTSDGLQALHAAGILSHVPIDPWGNPYVYRHPGQHHDIDLLSTGPDGVESEDDIAIWRLYGQP